MTNDTVPPSEIQRLLAAGQSPTLLDVRTPAEFARLHATGAHSVPLDQLDPASVSARFGTTPLYVLCHSGARAAAAVGRLRAAGHPQAFVVQGGTAAWHRAGLPVDRAPGGAISLERQVRIAAGSLVLLGLALAHFAHPLFLILPLFVSAGLVFAGLTDTCGMGLLLGKMPWNHGPATCPTLSAQVLPPPPTPPIPPHTPP